MEHNYKWKVRKGLKSETIEDGWTETLGQSIICIKHAGHKLDLQGEQPKHYDWRIVEYVDHLPKGEIDTINGTFDVNFFPLITDIVEADETQY